MREGSGWGTKVWRIGFSAGIILILWTQQNFITRREFEDYKSSTRDIAEEVKNNNTMRFAESKEALTRIERKVDMLIERDRRPPPPKPGNL